MVLVFCLCFVERNKTPMIGWFAGYGVRVIFYMEVRPIMLLVINSINCCKIRHGNLFSFLIYKKMPKNNIQ